MEEARRQGLKDKNFRTQIVPDQFLQTKNKYLSFF